MKHRWTFGLALALLAIAAQAQSQSQSDPVRAARSAVQRLLERRFDDVGRYRFYNEQVRPAGSSDSRVEGRGECVIRGDYKDFRYLAYVDRGGYAREVRVEFPSGLVVTEGDWSPDTSSSYLRIRSPRDGDRVRDGRVTISGYAESRDVRVQVFERSGDRVATESVRVRDGRWSVTIPLRGGVYRALAEGSSSRQRDEVRFTVEGDPFHEGDAEILRPRNRETIDSDRVVVEGRSTASQLRVQLTSRLNSVIDENRVSARGRFSTTFSRVREGDYKIRVLTLDGKVRDEKIILVRPRGGWGGSGGSNRPPVANSLTLDAPRNGSLVPAGSLRVAGRSNDTEVRVIVTDSRGRRVVDRRVRVSGGRFDTTVSVRDPGGYAVDVSNTGGTGRDRASFRVPDTGRKADENDRGPIRPRGSNENSDGKSDEKDKRDKGLFRDR